MRAGSQFAVSPGFTQELLDAGQSSIPLLPGVATPSEAMTALDAGYQYLKFFPAEPAGGVEFLRALAGPIPEARFCPTGGITADKARSYLALSNVICVGGTWMAPASLIDVGNWEGIRHLAAQAAALKDPAHVVHSG